jgi:hypothetical protein
MQAVFVSGACEKSLSKRDGDTLHDDVRRRRDAAV